LVVNSIFESLFESVNYKFWRRAKRTEKDSEIEIASRIADRMLEAGLACEKFLQIKIGYSYALDMKLSMLKYSRDLFEITQDERTARNIIMLLFERKISDSQQYDRYVERLKISKEPEYCLAVAFAMSIQGRVEEADFYVYKAFYYLDGYDDFDIYKFYLGYYSSNLYNYHERPNRKSVGPNTIVKLESTESQKNIIIVCLDSESEFNDPDNKSLGVMHIPSSSNIYNKLIGGSKGQIINIQGKTYKIIDFLPRIIFLGQFVFLKINQYPDRFADNVKIFNASDPRIFIEQIKQSGLLQQNSEKSKALLDAYTRVDGGIGLPIDSLVQGDYSRYITAMNKLLFEEDQVFLSGYPTIEKFNSSLFVPTLSTLILMCLMHWYHLLDGLKSQMIIPESYHFFFNTQYLRAKENQVISPGALGVEDDKLIISKTDGTLPEIWEKVMDFCNDVKKISITDEDRISFEFSDGITGEQLFANTGIDLIQLDALILSKATQAYYLSDDFFFNQIADYSKIKRLNFASLLYDLPPEMRASLAMELSKTNYVLTPFVPLTHDDADQMYENLMTGEKKKKYYIDFFTRYIQILDQYLQEYSETDDKNNNPK
jgi:hypothetical protein